jgi:hypothetical protein
MKNKVLSVKPNRLLIIYKNTRKDREGMNRTEHGIRNESLRCTSIESAKRILKKRVKKNIKTITFTNCFGEYQKVYI